MTRDFGVVSDSNEPKTTLNDFSTYIKEIIRPRGGHLYTDELQQLYMNWRKFVRDMSNTSWEQYRETLREKAYNKKES